MLNKIGIVVIGRNEAQHLRQCLLPLTDQTKDLVYVDSGSIDNSVKIAEELGVKVILLDSSEPYTAARGRNTGANYLLEVNPDLEFIQFIDGDSYIVNEWLEEASSELASNKDTAVVCGILTEQSPELSVYNTLFNLEWNKPSGEVSACGGNMMVRAKYFKQLEGFDQTLIAGEDPELCLRMRQQGWKIFKLDCQMGFHDGEMISFWQWWKRAIRSGYVYAEGSWLHGKSPEFYGIRESFRIWFWGFILPLLAIATIWYTHGLSLILLLVAYLVLCSRVYMFMSKRETSKDALIYATFCIVDKFPQLLGQIRFYLGKLLKWRSKLIEYKKVNVNN